LVQPGISAADYGWTEAALLRLPLPAGVF
jgi:hypothetical protein